MKIDPKNLKENHPVLNEKGFNNGESQESGKPEETAPTKLSSLLTYGFVEEIKSIIENTRKSAIRSVEFHRVQMYWKLGERIFNEEQAGKDRADYGKFLIVSLAKEIEPEFGTGFSKRQLERSRQFYRLYPIASALRSQFNWFQYRLLIAIKDPSARDFYSLETEKNNWTGRELERQINSSLYQRLLLSSDKVSVLAVANNERLPTQPKEIIKDPMFLEFLGLDKRNHFYEKELESALISHLEDFLLELGNGFSFVARQKRLLIEDDEFFADLVFYNRLLKCFVIIELKTEKMSHQDLGQLQMYVNYYDRYEKLPEENSTIGILLCPEKNSFLVELTLPDDVNIYASEYQLYLPEKDVLEDKMNEWIKDFDLSKKLENL